MTNQRTSIVKGILLFCMMSLTALINLTCSERDFRNPVDPEYEMLPPSNLQLTIATDGSATLSWKDENGFSTELKKQVSYNIEESTDQTNYTLIRTVSGDSTAVLLNVRLLANTSYYFRIRTRAGNRLSAYSGVVTSSVGPAFGDLILVQGGTFQMGSTTGLSHEQPVHSVTLSSFYIGRYEVTQKQWREVVQWKQLHGGTTLNLDPSYFKGDNLPVEQVTWDDIQLWLSGLNQREGTTTYRLPTEAEWEYAARGGNMSQGCTYSGSDYVDAVAWYDSNSTNKTHVIGTKMGNELGIYDMSGNVWEWCRDWFGTYSSGSQTNPTGPDSGTFLVLRGGSWANGGADGCRVAYRYLLNPDGRNFDVGFRLVRTF